jgi:signal transduction histidine kinase
VLLEVDESLGQDPFSAEAQMQVFRILQEALSNARKHGQAKCVQVKFGEEEGAVRLTVRDDGKGFDTSQAAGEGHYGLKFMRERVEGIGGRMEIESRLGTGTRIEIEIPPQRRGE